VGLDPLNSDSWKGTRRNLDNAISVIRNGRVLVDHGPITMTIDAKYKGEPYTHAAIEGAYEALESLKTLSSELPLARKVIEEIKKDNVSNCSLVLKKMIESVEVLEEPDFTPMASVAGAIADIVKVKVLEAGADYAVVNNGGDISYYISSYYNDMRIGIISDLSNNKPTHVIKIKNDSGVRGIATSGFGGRSLTKGVASAVTALAASGSNADAAATSIANATNCQDPSIIRCFAEEIDYFTDIRGQIVTRSIGEMEENNMKIAVKNGLIRAKSLYDKRIIYGAIIFVKNYMAVYPENPLDFTLSVL